MVTIRHFTDSDIDVIRTGLYPDMTENDIQNMLRDWNGGSCQGKAFEIFAVLCEETVVGTVSLYEHSKSLASAGAEIFAPYRRSGFAYEAMRLLLEHAGKRGYRVILDQVRTDNAASIRLHEKLAFESDRYTYRNRKDQPVYLFIKALSE